MRDAWHGPSHCQPRLPTRVIDQPEFIEGTTVLQDFRYAIRQIVRGPAFAIVASCTLAIGIGANSALYTMVDAIFLRPMPGVHARDGLVWITPRNTHSGRGLALSYRDFLDFRDSSGVFSSATAFGRVELSLATGSAPARVYGVVVDGNYFDLLGVRLAKGRGFVDEESRIPGTHPVAVVGYHMWQERLGGDPNVLGRQLVLNGERFTVVGVAPENFNGVEHEERIDVFVPMMMVARAAPQFTNALTNRGVWWLKAVGQLRPGVSVGQANAAVATIASRLARADSVNYADVTTTVDVLAGGASPGNAGNTVAVAGIATAATALILLICCANVSNMLLARAVARRREIGVRLSLGASRARLIRQLLTEAGVLSALAAGGGVLLSFWVTDVLKKTLPVPLDVMPNTQTIVAAIVVAIVTGALFGVVPALHATRTDLVSSLKSGTVGRDRGRSRLQRGFVVAQLSLSLVLLVMAGMFLSALYRSTKRDVGFDATTRVLAASFDLGMQGYTMEQATQFLDDLERRVAVMPGVRAVSITNSVPMGERRLGGQLSLDPRETSASASPSAVYQNSVRPDFFRALDISLVRGRDFTNDDRAGAQPVAIVSEDFARAAWPGVEPIGKHVSVRGSNGPFITVIGVARDALTYGANQQPRPTVYFAQRQSDRPERSTILVRADGDASRFSKNLRAIIQGLDKNLPVFDVQTLAQYRHDRLWEPTLGSTLLASVGALALLLACVGVYSVIAFSVGQRTREIGVRIALGAAGTEVTGMFVREGLQLTAVGLGVGLGLSAVLAKIIAAAFVSVSAADSVAFFLVGLLLAAVAAFASWLPARHAAGIDPMAALRSE